MKLEERIIAFECLRDKISQLGASELNNLCEKALTENNWFTKKNIEKAFSGIQELLNPVKLKRWVEKYDLNPKAAKTIGVVMAGNIPMVGFHDLLCILISGHIAAIKVSTHDTTLIKQLLVWLIEIEPHFKDYFELREKLSDIDAVIATGSDNSARYFEYYFSKYPHIIRKNRSSIAILSGDESDEQLKELGKDIFYYFGLGCRNVSKLFVPENYDFIHLIDQWKSYNYLIDHNKFANNYDYNKSILLINGVDHFDTGFSLIHQSTEIVSPISVTYFEFYHDIDRLNENLAGINDKIQCIVANSNIEHQIPFGKTQLPEVSDYADGIDTLAFLQKL